MSGRILERYTDRPGEPAPDGAAAEADGTEDLGSFGWLRGPRERAVMLELRKKTGNILAVGYGWLDRVEFDPSDGITLHAGGQRIRIKGRNLNAEARPQVRLFQGITKNRVPWVEEADQAAAFQADGRAVIVEAIEW